MTVEINEDGILTIKAETPLEAYALKHWAEETAYEHPKTIIDWGIGKSIGEGNK